MNANEYLNATYADEMVFHLVPSNADAVYEFCNHFPKWLIHAKEEFYDDNMTDVVINYGLVTACITSNKRTIKVSYIGTGCARYWCEDKTYLQEFAEDKRSFTKVAFDEFGFIINCDEAKLKEE